jgi:ABC-2 type transport system permease protein
VTPETGLLMFVQLCVASLGVLAVTSEYATGTIRTSLLCVPRRGLLLAGKSTVVGLAALFLGQVSVFAMFFLGRWIVGDRTIPAYATAVSEEVPRLLSLGLSLLAYVVAALAAAALALRGNDA